AALLALGLLALAGLVTAVVWFATKYHDQTWFEEVMLVSGGALTVVAGAVGGLVSWRRARGMRRWSQATNGSWQREHRVTVPSGVSAGWAAVYGVAFLALAWAA